MTTTQNETDSPIFVKSFPVGPLQCNCTIIGNTETGAAIVVDPGGDADRILALLSEKGLNTVKHILHTLPILITFWRLAKCTKKRVLL